MGAIAGQPPGAVHFAVWFFHELLGRAAAVDWLEEKPPRRGPDDRARDGQASPISMHLDRDVALKPAVASPVDLPHPALAERGGDFVRT